MPGLSAAEIEALANYFTGSASQSSLMQSTQQMQKTQMSFNAQYLGLQNQMQNENRQFTMVPNIMLVDRRGRLEQWLRAKRKPFRRR